MGLEEIREAMRLKDQIEIERQRQKRQNELNNMPWIRKLQEPEYIDQLKRLERTQKEVFNWAIKEKYKIKNIDIESEFGHFFLALLRGEVKSLHEYIYKNTNWLNKKDSKN